jgi:hypothetical protein
VNDTQGRCEGRRPFGRPVADRRRTAFGRNSVRVIPRA